MDARDLNATGQAGQTMPLDGLVFSALIRETRSRLVIHPEAEGQSAQISLESCNPVDRSK